MKLEISRKHVIVLVAFLLCTGLFGSPIYERMRIALSAYPASLTELWPYNSPFMEYDYTIGQYDATTYYMKNGSSGKYDFTSTSASAVFSNMLGNMSKNGANIGAALVKAGNYSLTSAITITGTGTTEDDATRPTSFYLDGEGEGIGGTVLQPSAGVDAITVVKAAKAHIRRMRIELPTTNSGYGIFGSDNGGATFPSETSFYFGSIENVLVRGGSTNSTLIYLENPSYLSYHDNYLYGVGAHALTFIATTTDYPMGDSYIWGMNEYVVTGAYTNRVCLNLTKTGSKMVNMVEMDGLNEFRQGGSPTGQNGTGIYLLGASRNRLNGIHIEGLDRGIIVQGGSENIFEGSNTYSYVNAAGTVFYVDGTSYNNIFRNWMLDVAQNYTIMTDLNTATNSPTCFIDFDLVYSSGGEIRTIQTATRINNVQWRSGTPALNWRNENTGSLSGAANETWVTHGCYNTPMIITFASSSEPTGYWWIASSNSTHFQIDTTSGTLTGTWYVKVKP